MICFLAIGRQRHGTPRVSFLINASHDLEAVRLAKRRAQRLGVPCHTWKLERVRTAGTERKIGALRGWLRAWWEE